MPGNKCNHESKIVLSLLDRLDINGILMFDKVNKGITR
jgi:hypothetical protein